MSTAPIRNLEHEPGGGGAASIGKSVTIKGQIFSREDLTIEGEIEGAIELNDRCLTVGPNGRVRAGIQARDVVILGQIDGNIEALDKIQIGKRAHFRLLATFRRKIPFLRLSGVNSPPAMKDS